MLVAKWIKIFLILIIAAFGHSSASAFSEHTCEPPAVPQTFETVWDLDDFTAEALVYRQCIERYLEAIKEQAAEKNALYDDSVYYQQKAIDDFNDFSDIAVKRINASDIPFVDAMD